MLVLQNESEVLPTMEQVRVAGSTEPRHDRTASNTVAICGSKHQSSGPDFFSTLSSFPAEVGIIIQCVRVGCVLVRHLSDVMRFGCHMFRLSKKHVGEGVVVWTDGKFMEILRCFSLAEPKFRRKIERNANKTARGEIRRGVLSAVHPRRSPEGYIALRSRPTFPTADISFVCPCQLKLPSLSLCLICSLVVSLFSKIGTPDARPNPLPISSVEPSSCAQSTPFISHARYRCPMCNNTIYICYP